mgnify:FL=1
MAFVSIEWLRRWTEVPADTSASQLAKDLVKVGLEEEAIHTSGVTGPLVCGRVASMVPETASNGKTVNYCRVDVGEEFNDAPGTGKEPSDIPSRSIICGAHNFKEGDHVVVSLPGAVLPGDFAIATRKTYGHISDGMICSARELGLGEEFDGIIVLEEYLGERGVEIPAPGTDMLPILGLNQELLEINITPDRGYCFSMRGVGREYSHSTGAKFTDWGLAENLKNGLPAANDSGFPVEIEDAAPIRGHVGCDRFVARIVRGLNPSAPTPQWMVARLESAGMRSISLPVDVTNYVMLDLGQPMHAYDLDKVTGPIVVRRARQGEQHTTLDDVERTLDAEDLLITDCQGGHGTRVLGIAGVMGGAETEMTETSTNVLLEAAHFDAVSVARSARRHKLPSEASKRFERGSDPELPPVAAQYAAELLVEYGGGTIDAGVTDVNDVKPQPTVTLPFVAATQLIGVDYAPERVEELLRAIGCSVTKSSDDTFAVVPPSWRPDLVGGPAHLIEEIARLDGYDKIPSVVPVGPAKIGNPAPLRTRREVSDTLAEAGFTEVMTYPFLGNEHDLMGLPADDPRRDTVKLANPLADDAPALRSSLLDTLLNTASRNVSRGNPRVAIFELDQVVSAQGVVPASIPGVEEKPSDEVMQALRAGVPKQPWHVAAVLAGNAMEASPHDAARSWDWADAIELAIRVAVSQGLAVRPEALGAGGQATVAAPFHPGRVAQIRVGALTGGKVLGSAGELHPKVCQNFGLPPRTCAFELDLDAIEKARPKDAFQLRPVSTFPAAKEDLAFVVKQDVPALKVYNAIAKAGEGLVEELRLFDVFENAEQLGEGRKSLAFALRLRAADHTLSPQEIKETRNRIIKKVEKTCQATLR